ELTNRYDMDNLLLIQKFDPGKIITAVYFDAKHDQFYAKRFLIESKTLKNQYQFIKEGEGNYLKFVTTEQEPVVLLSTGKKKAELKEEEMNLYETIDITGWK